MSRRFEGRWRRPASDGATIATVSGRGYRFVAPVARALKTAERLGDAEYQLRALWGLIAYRTCTDVRAASAMGMDPLA
jgi:hypothetical protein